MWQEQHRCYYKWDGEELTASLQHHTPERDNHPYERYGVQIHASDGGLVVIGYIAAEEFDPVLGKAICDMALAKEKDFDWWMENRFAWWVDNTALVIV